MRAARRHTARCGRTLSRRRRHAQYVPTGVLVESGRISVGSASRSPSSAMTCLTSHCASSCQQRADRRRLRRRVHARESCEEAERGVCVHACECGCAVGRGADLSICTGCRSFADIHVRSRSSTAAAGAAVARGHGADFRALNGAALDVEPEAEAGALAAVAVARARRAVAVAVAHAALAGADVATLLSRALGLRAHHALPVAAIDTVCGGLCPGRRRFRPLSALRAPTKAPYKTDFRFS